MLVNTCRSLSWLVLYVRVKIERYFWEDASFRP